MQTFEITIERKSGSVWPVVVEYRDSGSFLPIRAEGSLELDESELATERPETYGALLGKALFRETVRDAFQQARRQSEDALHVLLCIEDPLAKTFRWERLCAPLDGGRLLPLALDQRVPFSLYLPSITDRRFPPLSRRDLRALIVAANPSDLKTWKLEPFDAATAVRSVREALGPIPSNVLGPVENSLGPPTLDAICNALTAERYTLLHVVCHGRSGKADVDPVLYLAGPDGTVDKVPATRLLDRLGKLGGSKGLPHFAFLSSCESADPSAEGALGGMAQRLVRDQASIRSVTL